MKTGSPLMSRYCGSTLNFPLYVISWHSPFFLVLVLQWSSIKFLMYLTVSSAFSNASLRLVSSALISMII